MKEKFVNFLKKEGIYEKFKNYVEDDNYQSIPYSDDYNFEDFLISIDGSPDSAIVSAFIWNRTPEGHDFWKEIDEKWQQEVK